MKTFNLVFLVLVLCLLPAINLCTIVPAKVDQNNLDELRGQFKRVNFDNIYPKKVDGGSARRDLLDHAHHDQEEEESPAKRQSYIAAITGLRARLRGIKKDLHDQRQHKDIAMDAFTKSLDKRNSIAANTRDISEQRQSLEKDLLNVRSQLSKHETSLRELKDRARVARDSIKSLEQSRDNVLKQNKHISDDFQSHALQHWVDSSFGNSSVNTLIRGAFAQGVNFVEPVLDGFERLVDVNNQVTNTTSNELQRNLSLADRPFYAGFLTNLVLLVPFLLVMIIILRIKQSINQSAGYKTIGYARSSAQREQREQRDQRDQTPSRMMFRSDQRINMGGAARNCVRAPVQPNVEMELVVINLDGAEQAVVPPQRHDSDAIKSN